MAKDFFGRILNLIADRMRPYMTPDRPEGRPEGMRMFGIGEDDGIPEYGRGLTEHEAGELLALSFQKSRADLKIHKGGRSSAQDSIAVPVPDLYGDGGGIGRNIIYTFFAKHCWIGYKNCSLLLQHWLINRCCSLPAEDASAGGYRLEYADNNVSAGKKEDSKKKADLLPKIQAAAERRYGLSDKLRKLGFNRAGYGTGIAYFVIDGEDPETPLNLDGIRSGSFRGITIIEPQWCEPLLTETNVSDPLSPGWYRPEWYVINGRKVHRSRLFTTLYREAPDDLKPTYNFGGIPLPQMIYERVYSAEKVANEMLELVQTKRTFVMQGNTMEIAKKPRLFEKIYNALSRFRNNQSIMVVDRTDENFTQMDTSLADTDGITWTLYQLVAGVASIPEYKLYGTAMKGLNSTGEGETKNYLQMLRGMQENVFEPFLRKAYAIICRSDLGNREKYDIVFNPLSVPTDAEQAATQGAKSSYYGNLINAGVVSPEEVRQALRQDENSGFTDIAEDLPEDAGGEPPEENSGNAGGQGQPGGNGQDEKEADYFYTDKNGNVHPCTYPDSLNFLSVKNLKNFFLNSKKHTDWIEKLSEAAISAIKYYTDRTYKKLNEGLRAGRYDNLERNWHLTANQKEKTKELDSLIKTYELESPMIVYRSADPMVMIGYGKGDTFEDSAFLSTSCYSEANIVNRENSSLMIINVPKGKGIGAYIGDKSEYKNQYEFLIKRKAKLHVDDVIEEEITIEGEDGYIVHRIRKIYYMTLLKENK